MRADESHSQGPTLSMVKGEWVGKGNIIIIRDSESRMKRRCEGTVDEESKQAMWHKKANHVICHTGVSNFPSRCVATP